jgi:hypothetical protein
MILFFWCGWPKVVAGSDDRVLLGKWMLWAEKLEPNVHQDTIGKLSSRAFDWCNKNMVVLV